MKSQTLVILVLVLITIPASTWAHERDFVHIHPGPVEQTSRQMDVWTTNDFMAFRAQMRRANPTELQAHKKCEAILGTKVRMDSFISEVKVGGRIIADMDKEILSVDDITLYDLSERAANRLNQGQRIEYTGTIQHCKWSGSSLMLSIKNTRLVY